MYRLVTLGGLALLTPSGESPVAPGHRRKLALLAVLALADAPLERDALVEMFWGDEPDRHAARHSLSNTLSFLRSVIGRDAITMHRSAIVIAPGVVSVDAAELLDAARTRNAARVLELHRGPFLGDVVSGSPAFEWWAAGMRTRISHALVRAAELRCVTTAAAQQWSECEATARTWLDADPSSPAAAMHLLTAICAGDSPEARRRALATYDAIVERLAREQRTAPDARVTEAGRRLQLRVAAEWGDGTSQSLAVQQTVEPESAAHVAENAVEQTIAATPVASPSDRWRRRMTAVATGVAAMLVLGITSLSWLRAESTTSRPVVAITDIASVRGDSASAWLEAGLAQMLATNLTRHAGIDVIEPRRVRDVRARAQLPATGPLAAGKAAELARRLGATLVVRGTLTTGGGTYALSIVERDVKDGSVVTSFNVTGRDPISLADEATARLLATTDDARTPRVSFADVQTSNAEAFQHYLRAEQAGAEGRYAEQQRELDRTIEIDSGFGTALLTRLALSSPSDSDLRTRLVRALPRARFTSWDVMVQQVDSALYNGELQRSERLADELVSSYPHDPRAYQLVKDVYEAHGQFAHAAGVLQRELALDSLGDEAGRGPCVPCTVYAELAGLQVFDGHVADAERTARRWVRLQPDLPGAHSTLGSVLAAAGKFDEAVREAQRAIVLGPHDVVYVGQLARLLIEARRYAAADSFIAAQTAAASPELREVMADARVLLQRERGQLRKSIHFLDAEPGDAVALFERMDALSRLGDFGEAERLFARQVGHLNEPGDAPDALVGQAARSFAWSRSMEAEAIAGAGDTMKLRALADSIRSASARSYYGRDWRLHHHVLGRIAMQGKRYADAEREFAAAQWGASGWTTNLAWLARAQLAQHRPLDAVATLRRAYYGPLDAMGRYEPRSELDFLMSTAFSAAGAKDSAATYDRYVAAAWRDADPEVKRRLQAMEREPR